MGQKFISIFLLLGTSKNGKYVVRNMRHEDRVNLIRKGIPAPGGVWGDFGSGSGAFTLALAELIGPAGKICSVDKNRAALNNQKRMLKQWYPQIPVHFIAGDYKTTLNVPLLDGIVMANALHYQKAKKAVIQHIQGYLKPDGRLILVEYNIERGNPWVPFPIPYMSWRNLSLKCGFSSTRCLATRPSRFHREIYAALSLLK